MPSRKPHTILFFLGASILASTTCKGQFNEGDVAQRYSVLSDSLRRADSLLASGDRASALVIYQATTPWKHNARWRYVLHLKCTADPGQANRSTLDSLAHYGCSRKYLESDSLIWTIVGPVLRSSPYPALHRDPLVQFVDSLGELDQQVRDLPRSRENDGLIGATDSMNIDLLYSAFRENGGYISSIGSILILIHVLSDHQEHLAYFAQSINEALLDQKLDSDTYGTIVDEFFWHTKNCQVFGTIGHSDDVPGLKWCDPERTVRLRKLMGMPATSE
ncbi:MAG: hypothetical protein WBO28_09920 [Flavobacteriales bacterium]